ncbi:ubiquitin-conjugating enzyme E2 J2-like [Ornithodoros turicata]|uniref:Ubiquitin-conjugating enzyme E2 J2 n=1 Tax=Ornithodoros turicata TaxID=34597 RepID=A0A2R5LAH1_9ACAR
MNKKYNTAAQRLRQDYLRLVRDPVPYIIAHPLPSNILEWHYVVRGPEGTPYEDGLYHGKLMFPGEFPFKPPSIFMITPSGRFKCNTRLCLSISDFHPDSWNPAWSVATILTGLLSFMVEKNPTLGSIDTTDREKRQLAKESLEFNLKDQVFCELFPDLVEDIKEQLSRRKAVEAEAQSVLLAERSHSGPSMAEQGYGLLGSTLTNMFVIVGFAAFAYTVKYVLTFSAK